MGCTNVTKTRRNETMCLYKGKVFELKQRPGTWERLYNELQRVIGIETVKISVVEPGSKVSQVTEHTWQALSSCSSRLVLVVQPESQEETLSLQMTGKRNRDRKYSQVSRILTQLKSATEEFDRRFSFWYILAAQPSFHSAMLLTCAQVPLLYKAEFPYICSEDSTNPLWLAWRSVVEQTEVLDNAIPQTIKEIEVVANKRTIKRLGVFKKAVIDAGVAKAQENNVKMSMTQGILAVYSQHITVLKSTLQAISLRIRSKQQSRPHLLPNDQVGRYLSLCL